MRNSSDVWKGLHWKRLQIALLARTSKTSAKNRFYSSEVICWRRTRLFTPKQAFWRKFPQEKLKDRNCNDRHSGLFKRLSAKQSLVESQIVLIFRAHSPISASRSRLTGLQFLITKTGRVCSVQVRRVRRRSSLKRLLRKNLVLFWWRTDSLNPAGPENWFRPILNFKRQTSAALRNAA